MAGRKRKAPADWDHRKVSVLLEASSIDEIWALARERGISVSAVMQQAWRAARKQIKEIPGP